MSASARNRSPRFRQGTAHEPDCVRHFSQWPSAAYFAPVTHYTSASFPVPLSKPPAEMASSNRTPIAHQSQRDLEARRIG